MNYDENSLVLTISCKTMIIALFLFILIAYISAYWYRDTNDFKKAVKMQAILTIILGVIFIMVKLPIILISALTICSFVCGAVFSNYFFYK